MSELDLSNKKILVTGGNGFLGSYVVAKLKLQGGVNVFAPTHQEYDLILREACREVVKGVDIVIHLAALIGGIGFINKSQGEVFYNNLIMGTELMEAARLEGVEKYLSVGTVCEYPKFTELPFKEENLWDGFPDEITGAYGLAKKMSIVQGKAYKEQYDFNSIHLIPVNLYGPNDNFDRQSAHVIPALIQKIITAKAENAEFVSVWGSGNATREFLYVEDAAEGIILALQNYQEGDPVNLGTGIETSVKDVVLLLKKIIGFEGDIQWDNNKPDGQPRRQLDVSKAKKFGFEAKTSLEDGLRKTVDWYIDKIINE